MGPNRSHGKLSTVIDIPSILGALLYIVPVNATCRFVPHTLFVDFSSRGFTGLSVLEKPPKKKKPQMMRAILA